MPKIPQSIPPWFAAFVNFAKSKEDNTETKQSLDVTQRVIEEKWDEFVEFSEKNTKEKPKKPRTIDPIKNLGRAFTKVMEKVEEAGDNETLVKQYTDQVKKVVPNQMVPLLSEIVTNTNSKRSKAKANTEKNNSSGQKMESKQNFTTTTTTDEVDSE